MANRFFEGAAHAAAYVRFRPHPPQSLIEEVMSYLKGKYNGTLAAAVDVGCGSGQSTWVLAPHFTHVTGLDVSSAQITEATKKNTKANVSFKVSGAETLPFPAQSVQLITAGQACHWFDLPKFYAEADRVLVPGGVLALYGYLFPLPMYGNVSNQLVEIVNDMYKNKLDGYIHKGSMEVYLENYQSEKYNMIYDDKMEIRLVYTKDTEGYWGEGRADVDEAYTDPKFNLPLQDCSRDDSHYTDRTVSVTDLTGYISSWSGFQNFQAKNGDEAALDLLQNFQNRIMSVLGVDGTPEDKELTLRYKYFLLMGRKP